MAASRTSAGASLGAGIFLLALGTAAIHLYMGLNFGNMLFVLNGPGYMGLLAVLRLPIPQARHRPGCSLHRSRAVARPRRPAPSRQGLPRWSWIPRVRRSLARVLRRGSPTRRVCRQEPAQPAIEATAPSVTTASSRRWETRRAFWGLCPRGFFSSSIRSTVLRLLPGGESRAGLRYHPEIRPPPDATVRRSFSAPA